MNLQRREEIKVIAECPNDRHWAQEMRRAVAELLTHIDALEQAAAERVIAEGSRGPGLVPAVVVPDVNEIAQEIRRIDGKHDKGAGVIAEELRDWLLRHLRTIPADRELMRLVDELIRWHGLRPLDKRPDHAAALVGAIKALRANQGGTAT